MTGETKELVVSSRSVDSFCRLSISTDNYIKKAYDFVPNFVPLHGYPRDEIRNVSFWMRVIQRQRGSRYGLFYM